MLKIGISSVDITPKENVPLQGYGDRTHDSTGVHDPLFAYAWWIESEDGQPMVWVVLDLCLLSVLSANDLCERLAEKTGLSAERIFISTTHTHSGPAVRFLNQDQDPWAVRYNALLFDRLTEVIEQARSNPFTGHLEIYQGYSDLGINRRDAQADIDPRIILFRLLDGEGQERGIVFHYSCHLTVQGVENYLISADWVGPVRQTLEADRGVPVMYIQGAEGNIDPVCRGILDMADPDQALGSSFEIMDQTAGGMIGSIQAALATDALGTIETLKITSRELQLPLRYGGLNPAQVQEKIEDWKSSFATFLGIDQTDVPETGIINALVKEKCRAAKVSPTDTRKWVAEQFTYTSFINIYKIGGEHIDPDRGQIRCPVTSLDFGPVHILGIPAEVLVENAFDFQSRNPDRIALICGLFGGWLGYLPHPSNFQEAQAAELYETVCTQFAEQAATAILDAVRI